MIDLKTNQNISANKGGQPDYVSISHLQMKAGKNARVVIEILSGQSCYIPPYYGGSGSLVRVFRIQMKGGQALINMSNIPSGAYRIKIMLADESDFHEGLIIK